MDLGAKASALNAFGSLRQIWEFKAKIKLKPFMHLNIII